MTLNVNKIEYKYIKIITFKNLKNWDFKSKIVDNDIKNIKDITFSTFLKRNKTPIFIQDNTTYKRVTIKLYGKGIILRDKKNGAKIGTKKQYLIKKNQFLMSKIDARNGAFGIVNNELDGAIITGNFWSFDVDFSVINMDYLKLYTSTKYFAELCRRCSVGTTGRHYLQEKSFLNFKINLPSLSIQKDFVEKYTAKILEAKILIVKKNELKEKIENYLIQKTGITFNDEPKKKGIYFINFKDLKRWTSIKTVFDKIQEKSKYKPVPIIRIAKNIFRGKSPKYVKNSNCFILNQKCNRWDEINLEYTKTVNEEWYKKQTLLTREHDVLINSTGEGTIGRATYISKPYEGLLFDSHILLFRGDKNIINGKYFVYWFNSKINQDYLNETKSAQTTKQTELGSNNLGNMLIPLPPIQIQNKIVNQIDIWKNNIEKIKKEIKLVETEAQKEFANNF